MPRNSLHAHLSDLHRRWVQRSEEAALPEKYQASPKLQKALGKVLDAYGASVLDSQGLSRQILEAIPFHGSGVDEYATWELRACLMDHGVSVPVVAPGSSSEKRPASRLARQVVRRLMR